MPELLTTFNARWDPLHRGRTPAGIATGTLMTAGGGYPARAGVHLLYMSVGEAPSEADAWVVGACSPTADPANEIKNFPTYPLPPSSVCWFWVRAVSPGGAEESSRVNAIRIKTDSNGDPVDPAPNRPTHLTATAIAGGRIRLTWQYDPVGEQAPVSQFSIYHDNGGGVIDLNTPLDTTSARVYVTDAYAHGTTVKFTVRSRSSGGVEETNRVNVSATADAEGPPDLPAPTLTMGAVV